MDRLGTRDKMLLFIGFLLAVNTRADAYIDPGTGSVAIAAACAPLLALLAWFGRRVVRLVTRSKSEPADEAGDGECDD